MVFPYRYADVMELVDMQDLGSCAQACGFESLHPQSVKYPWDLSQGYFYSENNIVYWIKK